MLFVSIPFLMLFKVGRILGMPSVLSLQCNGYQNSRLSYTSSSIIIAMCVFMNLTESSYNGGSVCYVGSGCISFVDCTFAFSKSSNTGGAIYTEPMDCSLIRVCGYQCQCGVSCNFAYLTSSSSFNNVSLLTVTKCTDIFYGDYSIYMNYGIQNVFNFNSSYNKCQYGSSIFYNLAYSTDVQYNILSHNRVSNYICFCFKGGVSSVKSTSVIDCNSPSLSVLYTYGGNSLNMNTCVFMNNSDALIYGSNSIYISNCAISHGSNAISGLVTIGDNVIYTISNLPLMDIFSSAFCDDHILIIASKSRSYSEIRVIFSIYLLSNAE